MNSKARRKRNIWTLLKISKTILISLIIILLVIFLLYLNKLRTLMSLNKVDNHPLYVMKYYDSYAFDKYLKVGSKNYTELNNFLYKNLISPISISSIENRNFACTSFSEKNDKNEAVFGRNYDYLDTYPSLLLFTSPPKGYKSVSMVNIQYANIKNIFSKPDYSPITSWKKRELLLAAPYLPYDGMNEYGLVISVNSVPTGKASSDQLKKTIGFTEAIRLVLDHAKNIDEAISLLEKYNIDFVTTNQQPIHFHIADSSGKSVVVEYVDGKTQILRNDDAWSVATNFVLYQNTEVPDSRYTTVNNELKIASGIISKEAAMNLLKKSAQPKRTNWSVVYNQKTGDVQVVMGEKYDNILNFKLEMAK